MDASTPETTPEKTTVQTVPRKKQRLQAAIENAQKLLEQRKAALQAIEAREKARENRVPASTVNKQKFLLGAYVMETRPNLVKSPEFQAWLKRPQDRSVFGLEPVAK